jgi:hypothetical protein
MTIYEQQSFTLESVDMQIIKDLAKSQLEQGQRFSMSAALRTIVREWAELKITGGTDGASDRNLPAAA